MAWPSQNIDQDSLEFPAEQEGISDSIFPQLALVRPGDASTWTSPWLYSQPNHLARNDTPYYVVNNNNPQAIPTAFLGPTNHITSATPLEAHVIQRAHCQELPQSGVIGNANNTNGRPPVHRQGCGQDNPNTILRCDWPGCKYNRTFSAKRSLNRHIKEQHVNRHSFPCEICGVSFAREANKKKHLLKIHKVAA